MSFRCKSIKIGLLLLAGFLFACGQKDAGGEAAKAAKAYYDQLLAGDYDAYMAGVDLPDSVPADYYEQMVANMRMFMGRQDDEHRGVKEVRVVRGEASEDGLEAQAFLMLCFGDSTSEEICVPMIERNGAWRLR